MSSDDTDDDSVDSVDTVRLQIQRMFGSVTNNWLGHVP